MKTKSKLIGIIIIALILTSSVSSLVNFSNAGGPNSSYTINLTSINGQSLENGPFSNPVTLTGTAAGTNFVGQLSQYHIQITWGDGIIEVVPQWISLTQNGENFEGQWTITHYYTQPGFYDINIKLFHSQPPGNEGAFDASFTGTDIGVSSAIGLSLSLASPQILGTLITATANVAPNTATGNVQFQVQTPGSSLWSTFDTKTLSSPPTVTSNSYQFTSNPGVYKFKAIYSGDSLLKSSQSPEISIQVNDHLFVTISPPSATIAAGSSQVFTATPGSGSGTYTKFVWTVDGNPVLDDSQSYTFTSQNAGMHTITVTVTDSLGQTAVAPATCTVTALSLDHITISPISATITIGGIQQYFTEGFDIYGNDLGSINDAIYSASTGATVIGNSVSATIAGTYKVAATYEGKISPEATLTVIPGDSSSVSYFAVVASPNSVIAGGSVTVTVTAKDQYGNTVPSYAVTVSLSCSDAQAVLPVNVGLVGGVGSFSVTLKTVGSQTVTATAGSIIGASNPIAVTPGDPSTVSYFLVEGPSYQVTAGVGFSITVTAKDTYGNTIQTYVGTIHFGSNDTGVGVSLPSDYTFVGSDNGVHIFDNIILVTGGSQRISASEGSKTGYTYVSIIGSKISGYIFNDANANGLLDFGETGLAGWITTFSTGASTTTDGTGHYQFIDLPPGSYNVAFSSQPTWIHTTPLQLSVTAQAGQNYDNNNFGVVQAQDIGIIHGQVFNDVNANGVRDAGELGLSDWTVTLSLGSIIITTTSDANGYYAFAAAPGYYKVSITPQLGWVATTEQTVYQTVTVGNLHEVNFGQSQNAAKIAGYAFDDANGNGLKGSAEIGIAGVTVTLFDGVNTISTQTDSLGSYEFLTKNLGSYTITFTPLAGWISTTPNQVVVTVAALGTTYTVDFGGYLRVADHIEIQPKSITVNTGVSQSYTAKAYDTLGYSWDVIAEYSCLDSNVIISGNSAYSNKAGTYIITGTLQGKTDDATLTVTGHLPDAISITIAPKTQAIVAGSTQAYTATAFDGYNMWDITSLTTFSIQTSAGGSWTANTYTSAKVGTWTITGVYQTLSDTASLTVTTGAPETVTHFVITTPSSAAANASFSITVLAKDTYENTVTSYSGPINFNSDDPLAKFPLNPTIVNGVGSFTVTLVSLGSRQINVVAGLNTGSATIGVVGATVSGYVFNDINTNGVRDTGEVGLAGWTIKLNGTITLTTDSAGYYEFLNLPLANYVITETSKSGWVLTSDSDLTLSVQAGQVYGENNFGNVEASAVIRGVVFNDSNSNGYKDFNELGLAGWILNLNGVANVTTDNNGLFTFTVVSPPTVCVIRSYDEAGWRPTTPSTILVQTQSGGLYEVEFGKTDQSGVAAIYGYIFNDVNGNGVWDSFELGLSGWTVNVTQGSNKIVTTTNLQGFYLVTIETSGYYTVSTAPQFGWRATSPGTIIGYAELGGTYQADFAYQNPTINYITIAPKTATVNAGITQQFTVTSTDTYGNTWTVIADYSSNSADVVISGNGAYSNKAGTYTITGTYGGKSDTATLTVIGHLPDATSISISPKTSTITAGTIQTYTATASDAYGNTWDVTSATTFNIQTGAEGSWTNNIYTSSKAGTWTVTGNYQTVSDAVLLTVTHSDDPAKLASLSLSPASAIVAAGQSQSYAATATDTFGNSWIITGSTLFSIDASAGGSWSGAAYTAEKAGVWTVTGIYLSKSGVATLTVTHSDDPAKLDYIIIAPKSAVINVGETQSYSATAFDIFGNSWVITATYSCTNPNVTIEGNIAISNIAGLYQINGAFGGKTDSATLSVIGQLPPIVGISISPSTASVIAGNSQIFTTTATDGIVTWDVTDQVVWVINAEAGGSWVQAAGTYTSQLAGTWIVKATIGQLSDTAILEVHPNSDELGQISIDPKSPVTRIGAPQSFTVTAYDLFGNIVGDVTEYTTISAPGTSVVGNTVTVNSVGAYIVTAIYAGLTDTATLTITGNSVTFKAEGLPIGTNWVINFDGKEYYSTTDQITITDLSGTTYFWSTAEGIIQGQTRFKANQTSGSIIITQGSTQTIKYSTQYLVTYTITGNSIPVTMPAAEWVDANGSATGVFPNIVQNIQGNTRAVYMSDNRTQTITRPTTITGTYQTQYIVKYQTTGNGLPVTVPADQWVTSGGNATGTFPTQIATQNTRVNLLGDNRTTIVQPTTVTANYQTQYYITISSVRGSPTKQSQWVNAASDFTVSVTSPEGDTSHRYICTGYVLDSNAPVSQTSVTLFNIQQPHTVTFNWTEQYYLAINSPYGTSNGAGWYNAGTAATASVSSSTVSAGSGTQYVFTNWSGDASGFSTTSSQITMNAAKTAIANWKAQYFLTVNSGYGNPTGQGWYDSGSSATISVSSNVDSGASRYIFRGWSGNGYTGNANSAQIQINGPITQTASWQTQYLVSYKVTGNALVISLPEAEWVNSGEAAKGQFTTMVTNAANNTRCLLLSDNRPSSITKPSEITASYQTQFQVVFEQEGIKSDSTGLILALVENGYSYLEMPMATWANKDSEVTFNYTSVVAGTGFGSQYVLTDVNVVSPLTVVAPTQIKATYESQTILFAVAGSALLLFLLLLLLFLIIAARRRKKKKQEKNAVTVSPPSASSP